MTRRSSISRRVSAATLVLLAVVAVAGAAKWTLRLTTFQPHSATVHYDNAGRVIGIYDWRTDGVEPLSRLPHLVHLNLDRAGVTDADLRRLAALHKLTTLRLGGNRLTDSGVAHLSRLTRLTWLSLKDNGSVTSSGLPHLSGLSALKRLDLRGTRVEREGVNRLKKQIPGVQIFIDQYALTGLSALRAIEGKIELDDDYHVVGLEFAQTTLADEHLQHLAGLPRLRMLHLGGTGVTDAGIKHLCGLSSLEELWLSDTQVSDTALRCLAALPNLTGISFTRTAVTDAGLEHLRGLAKLSTLHLEGTGISDRGIDLLSRLPHLQHVWLDNTDVTALGVRRLRKALPGAQVFGPEEPAQPLDEIESHVAPG